ncbi:MAG: hypothetical protein ACI8RA_002884, partial [Chlamydiales bacterium]
MFGIRDYIAFFGSRSIVPELYELLRGVIELLV